MSSVDSHRMNLVALQRLDPAINNLLGVAGHVALYAFDATNKSWDRKECEGSLFIVQRTTEPHHRVFVMNRISRENFVEDLLPGFEMELSEPYLLFRNVAGVITGVWFYNKEEGKAISALIERILSSLPPRGSFTPPPKSAAAATTTATKESTGNTPVRSGSTKKKTRSKREKKQKADARNSKSNVVKSQEKAAHNKAEYSNDSAPSAATHSSPSSWEYSPAQGTFDPEKGLLLPSFFRKPGSNPHETPYTLGSALHDLSGDQAFINAVAHAYHSLRRGGL